MNWVRSAKITAIQEDGGFGLRSYNTYVRIKVKFFFRAKETGKAERLTCEVIDAVGMFRKCSSRTPGQADPFKGWTHASHTLSQDDRRRWLALAVMVAAQFIYVVDAFIVNVEIPAIRADIQARAAEVEVVIAIYQIAYASVIISGGRLGDIYGQKRLFLLGLIGFVAASLWCGLSGSALSLIVARFCEGAAAALMVPQILATIQILGPERRRAFGIFGMALGFGGAAGFVIGGFLVTLDLAGLGWRLIFFINIPICIAIAVAALLLLPRSPGRRELRLDLPGASIVFAALTCLIGPVLVARDLGWAPWLWVAMAAGVAMAIVFLGFERRLAGRGGSPLIDVGLLHGSTFLRVSVPLSATSSAISPSIWWSRCSCRTGLVSRPSKPDSPCCRWRLPLRSPHASKPREGVARGPRP
ncbi:Major Facilitator Superfamily protein [Rhizobiales bacterium GAS191]|nr:Major Facilitator Superfamily protein [Rhizobiales bacterium GAS191]